MDHQPMRDRALALLKRRGSITYGEIQRYFELDDASLAQLKTTLKNAAPGLIELDGPGLAWTERAAVEANDTGRQAQNECRFHTMVLATMALLQREQRITYRTLRHILGSDEASLQAVGDELRFRGVAREEDGRGLVWLGEKTTPGSATPATAPHAAIATPAFAPTPTPMATPEPAEAERRQLTVMFCDLVGSTDLSGRLDPEDLRAVVRAYQETAAEAIHRYEGHIAQYLGDGLLVYFGFPLAHEDDAQRSVHTALAIVAGMAALNRRLDTEHGVQLAVRLGIHTGQVVVGQMGGGGRHEQLALGETPNIAARLEGLAAPNGVVISPVTARIVANSFTLETMGPQTLKGLAAPMEAWRVVGLRDRHPEPTEGVASGQGAELLVGRDEESGLLRRRWEQSKDGLGQVVLVSGEAGIGKSVLVEGLRAQARAEGATRITFRASPYHTNSALYCVSSYLEQTLQSAPGEDTPILVTKLEARLQLLGLPLQEMMPLFAALLSILLPVERYTPLVLTPQQQKQQTLDALVAWLTAEAERQPVVATWEDLHWADPTTLELLGLLINEAPTLSILHVLTYRPVFRPTWSPQSHMTPIVLARLERGQVKALIALRAQGKMLPAEVVEHIISKTDGVPLYVEEITIMLLRSALLREEADRYVLAGPLNSAAIPDTLQDALMARLDQFKMAKEVAQLGAVLGREFAYAVLLAIGERDETGLQEGLEQLVKSELLHQRGRGTRAKFTFKHALLQDAAYASLLKSSRQLHHQRIAEVLEAQFPEMVDTQPELLAHHYGMCGNATKAVEYSTRAGQKAARQSANEEAINHLSSALSWLASFPQTVDRDRQELALLLRLGASLMATKGFSAVEVDEAYTRAQALSLRVGEPLQVSQVVFGLWAPRAARGDHAAALVLGEQFLPFAQAQQLSTAALVVNAVVGTTMLWRGRLDFAQEYLELALAARDVEQHGDLAFLVGQDPGLMALGEAAGALWYRGYPDQALDRAREVLAAAKALDHPFTLVAALRAIAFVHLCRREGDAAYADTEALLTLSRELGFVWWVGMGAGLQGAAIVERAAKSRALDQAEAGSLQIEEGLAVVRSMGAEVFVPKLLCAQARALVQRGATEPGLAVIADALAMVEKNDERWDEAELYRLKGELLLQKEGERTASGSSLTGPPTEAEACFLKSIDIARSQRAKSLELRVTTCLARYWLLRGKAKAAHEMLSEIYDWFTEGFDTIDLLEAKGLLAEIGEA